MAAAELISSQFTNDGHALLLTLHVSGSGGEPIRFPVDESMLPNAYAKLLFKTASRLPPEITRRVNDAGIPASEGAKGYVFNGRMEEVLRFFEIGTRPRLTGGDR
jgi:hypothetical protein